MKTKPTRNADKASRGRGIVKGSRGNTKQGMKTAEKMRQKVDEFKKNKEEDEELLSMDEPVDNIENDTFFKKDVGETEDEKRLRMTKALIEEVKQ